MEKRGTYKRTPETLEKMRLNNLGVNNPAYGKPTSKLQKETVRKALLGNKHRLGKIPYNKGTNLSGMLGKKHNYNTINKMSEAKKGRVLSWMFGEKHWNWKGGNKNRDIHSLFNPQYVEWRTSVFKRDNFSCRIADVNCGGQLQAHHILPWRDYVELRYVINNGITLCVAHHPRKRKDEAELSSFFQRLVAEVSSN